jgi:molybdate transport system substrate-binding protein
MRRRVLVVASLAVVALLLLACSVRGSETDTRELTVAAAADLQLAFTEIGEHFTERTGWQVTFSFGSTGNLTAQIEEGAPFDVFAAANVAFVDRLIDGGHAIAGTKDLYAVGRVVLASSRSAGANVRTLEGLLDPAITRIAIANPDHAPYGLAAKEALIGAGLWDELEPKLVYGENVRQALQFVETGNAEAGIVALSIAESPDITWVLIDDALHNPLLQAIVAVSHRPHEAMAREFIDFVMSDEGQATLARYGFVSAGDARDR